MANIFCNNNPLSGLSKRVDRLENAMKKLERKVSRDRKVAQDGHFHYVLRKVMNHNRLMAESVERLKVYRKRSGRFDNDIADVLNQAFFSLASEVEALGKQEMTQGHILGRTPIFRGVRTRLNDLGNNVSKLNEVVERQTEAIMEKDPYHEPTRRLRDAVREVDEKLAKRVSLKDLDEWMVNFFPVNWEDPRTLQRVAKVYVLAQIPFQTWELRYRSGSPGRPLLLLAETSDFPDIEFLESYEADYGHHDEYYIAARFPSWRIVWKSSWY